jgi:hypothetical protein
MLLGPVPLKISTDLENTPRLILYDLVFGPSKSSSMTKSTPDYDRSRVLITLCSCEILFARYEGLQAQILSLFYALFCRQHARHAMISTTCTLCTF